MISIRPITDLKELLKWRKEVIQNVFDVDPDDKLMKANEDYYKRHLEDGSNVSFTASFNDVEAGCGCICLTEELPSPDNPSGRCAYLMNIYVKENFRQHGVAHAIVKRLIEEAKACNCNKIYLETTPDGRPVYESLGFKDLPDMMKLS